MIMQQMYHFDAECRYKTTDITRARDHTQKYVSKGATINNRAYSMQKNLFDKTKAI